MQSENKLITYAILTCYLVAPLILFYVLTHLLVIKNSKYFCSSPDSSLIGGVGGVIIEKMQDCNLMGNVLPAVYIKIVFYFVFF